MLDGSLRRDIEHICQIADFHTNVVWVIGGCGATYGLGQDFTIAQDEIIALFKSFGQVVYNGITAGTS